MLLVLQLFYILKMIGSREISCFALVSLYFFGYTLFRIQTLIC